MMSTETREERLVSEDKIFLLYETELFEHYLVKGTSATYSVYFNKIKEDYSCDPCKNIRFTPCYHIKGVILYKKTNGEKKCQSKPCCGNGSLKEKTSTT